MATMLLAGGARASGTQPGVIAYARHDGVWFTTTDGGRERLLWRTPRPPTGVAWSPDGRRLAVTTHTGLWVVGADGAAPRRLVSRGEPAGVGVVSPTWSPDSRRIAFTAGQGADRDVWLVGVRDRTLRRVTTTPRHYELDVDWGPRGRLAVTTVYAAASIVGTSDPDASPDVWIVTPGGRYVQNLTPGLLRGWEPDWSPDGRRIVLPLWLSPERRTELYVVELDRMRLARLTDDLVDEGDPSWSPDGRRIAFVRGPRGSALDRMPARSGAAEIFLLGADGSGLTRLTQNGVAEAAPAWQPARRRASRRAALD